MSGQNEGKYGREVIVENLLDGCCGKRFCEEE